MNMRESTFEGEQIRAEDIVDQLVNIVKVKVDKDDRGDWADYQVEHEGKRKAFITGSGPLIDSAKTILKKDVLKDGPITATLRKTPSRSNPRQKYYQWE